MKEVTKKESTEVTNVNNAMFEGTLDTNISASELVIPKLILAQPGSPQVIAGDWMFGDLRSTLDDSLMAAAGKGDKAGKHLEFTPIHHQKFWLTKRKENGKFKFETMEQISSKNEHLDAFETWNGSDGIERKREFLHLFYILIPGFPLPFTLGFRGASKRNGDKLVTQMYVINKMLKTEETWKRSPFAKVMKAVVRKESKNDNNYAVLDISVLRDSTYDEACEALRWFKEVKSGTTKVDNSDLEQESKYSEADVDSLAF